MQQDFHYYATYCAAFLAGFTHEESLELCYAAQFADCCSETFLGQIGGPREAATTQLQSELINTPATPMGLQKITRIWSSFHFLPYDLNARLPGRPRQYMNKYRLICKPNGALIADTLEVARRCGTLQAAGIAMHVLADSWAHSYFAGTPSLVINNTNGWFYERLEDGTERKISFRHSASAPDDPAAGIYSNSIYQTSEISVMNLGHGRAGHLPDYSYARYRYLPAWGDYEAIEKDNPSEYYHAFCQMIYAMKVLRGEYEEFQPGVCDEAAAAPWRSRIDTILRRRQVNACEDWRRLGEQLSGQNIPDFDMQEYARAYREASREERDDTRPGQFFLAAMAQKSMVTARIFRSGSLLAGFSVDYEKFGFRGLGDYRKLIERMKGGRKDEHC